jgi:ABC-type molybdenum transport system ATPase subunit/photorepair protein PhrA
MSYLTDFLFSPARANSPVRTLSGGERNRLLLARLFALPANVLVLDEPTNDLDIDTLELLEDLLQTTPARSSWSATTGASWTTWSPAPSPGSSRTPRPARSQS